MNYVFLSFSAVQIYDIHISICRGNDVTTFESRDKFPGCYHLHETSQGVLYACYYYIHIISGILFNINIGFTAVKRFNSLVDVTEINAIV